MALEKRIADETVKNTIDLLVMMVVDELAENLQIKPAELLPKFIVSQTGKLLYDEESKLWWSGPSDIAEMFQTEMKGKPSSG